MSRFSPIHELYFTCLGIFHSELSWSDKYDEIFGRCKIVLPKVRWYDPDGSEEEDVTAWMKAFKEYLNAKV